MSQNPDVQTIRCRYVITSPTEVLENACVSISGGRVIEVDSHCQIKADIELTESALLPGLINAHCHLELSDIPCPLPIGTSFPDWIGGVLTHRRASQLEEQDPEIRLKHALQKGIKECYASGSHVVCDIVQPPWSASLLPTPSELLNDLADRHSEWALPIPTESPSSANRLLEQLPAPGPRIIALPEVIGLTPDRFDASVKWSQTLQATQPVHPLLMNVGLSPHAPYSVPLNRLGRVLHPEAFSRLGAIHLAESRDEIQWIESQAGAFRTAYERLQLPLDQLDGGIEEGISLLSRFQRGLVIHGNFLTDAQITSIGQQENVSVVFCPRTHRHFGHSHEYPLAQFDAANVPVSLGTDSRASSPDLNLWSEMQAACETFPELSPQRALASITTTPAEALGIETDYGRIAPGQVAALNLLPVSGQWGPDETIAQIVRQPVAPIPLELWLRVSVQGQ